MVNYQQGKIYKIVCNITGKVYVGSTCLKFLCQRLANHVALYNLYLKGKKNYMASYDIIEKGNYEIFLLESCPCETKDELLMRERHYIENMECINIIKKPIITNDDERLYQRNYYAQHIEQMRLIQHNWREKNRENERERGKIYREENKAIRKKKRQIKTLYLNQLKYYNI
jgi:hypothetical protein